MSQDGTFRVPELISGKTGLGLMVIRTQTHGRNNAMQRVGNLDYLAIAVIVLNFGDDNYIPEIFRTFPGMEIPGKSETLVLCQGSSYTFQVRSCSIFVDFDPYQVVWWYLFNARMLPFEKLTGMVTIRLQDDMSFSKFKTNPDVECSGLDFKI
ncbi:hypothetical protein TNCV_2942301 [Trichonephila clavipes]|nr:hypothetical protein TNCV_2942301 [Trichonephila clavipes]